MSHVSPATLYQDLSSEIQALDLAPLPQTKRRTVWTAIPAGISGAGLSEIKPSAPLPSRGLGNSPEVEIVNVGSILPSESTDASRLTDSVSASFDSAGIAVKI